MGTGGNGPILSYVSIEADWQFIDEELRNNGVKLNTDEPGLALLKHIGLQMEMSPNVGRGRFVVGEVTCQPFGVLHGGMTALIAETLASRTGHHTANGQPVQSMELNANHIRAVPIGEKVCRTHPATITSLLKPVKLNYSSTSETKVKNQDFR